MMAGREGAIGPISAEGAVGNLAREDRRDASLYCRDVYATPQTPTPWISTQMTCTAGCLEQPFVSHAQLFRYSAPSSLSTTPRSTARDFPVARANPHTKHDLSLPHLVLLTATRLCVILHIPLPFPQHCGLAREHPPLRLRVVFCHRRCEVVWEHIRLLPTTTRLGLETEQPLTSHPPSTHTK